MKGLLLVIILIGLYLLPTIIAASRSVPNVGSVAVINIFLGWSVVGWVVALAMAARSQPQPVQVIQHAGSPPPSAEERVTAQSPAGWYPDPQEDAELQYWYGVKWTNRTSLESDVLSD